MIVYSVLNINFETYYYDKIVKKYELFKNCLVSFKDFIEECIEEEKKYRLSKKFEENKIKGLFLF